MSGLTRYRVAKDGSLVRGIVRKKDSKNLHSFQLGCPQHQQKEMLRWYEEHGIRGVAFHGQTDEAIWPDRHTQIKAAKLHGLEVD